MQIHVIPADWSRYRDQLRAVRERVFIEEQRVPRELEWDGEDDVSRHFLALDESGRAVGCARLLPSGQIGRMAVLPELRGCGLGARLLGAAVDEARRQGMRKVFLHAQTHAAGFYRKAGFVPVGGEYMEAGIPHQSMELELPIPFEAPGEVPAPVVQPRPGSPSDAPPSELRQLHGEGDCLRGLVEALELPRRKLLILSPQLDHALFDHADVTEAVSRFARSSPSATVRILIADSSAMVSRGHDLVELARRLDSSIEIRKLPEAQRGEESSFVTWDEQGYLLLPDFRSYEAVTNPGDPVQARRLTEDFTRLWDRSAPDPELRTLRL